MSGSASGRPTIVIAGGGPVGLAVAALLGRSGRDLSIHLYEPRKPPAWNSKKTDLRVYALSRASQHILEHCDVWADIRDARVSPYRRMHVWQDGFDERLGSITFDSAEAGEPDLGHIVEDNLLRDRLASAAIEAGADLNYGCELSAFEPAPRSVEVTTSAGERLAATLLIGADGGESAVRERLEMPMTAVSYAQRGVVTHVETERDHEETAWQRFLPGGPLAFLPLSDGRSSIVWSTPTEYAEALCEMPASEFLVELQNASDNALGTITGVADRASFPLRVAHAREYCRQRVALIGDAAHTVHPLAGQGMNLGLLDAAVLADVLLNALERGEDAGDLRVLRRFERNRKGKNLKMLLAMDSLHRLFSITGPVMPPIRAAGLSAVDSTPFVKSMFMRQALGLRGDLPPAAKPRVA